MQLDAEVESLVPGRSFDRRGFMKTALGSAFAAAVLPVSAQTVHTDFNGLTAGEVTVPVGDFKMPAYRAQPEGKTKLPVVILISEIFGVHEYIADICRRFAKLGYLAIAPELFVRQGDPRAYGTVQETVANVVSKVPDSQVAGDIDATIAWATENGGDAARIGMTGFCWGGRQVWLAAERNPGIKAAVAWYGPLKGNPNPLQPVSPVDKVDELKAPVLGLYGAKDTVITEDVRDTMKVALEKSRNPKAHASRIIVYPNSGHAFHADYRPSYVKADAEDGWKKCLAWFKDHGVV
ncbi:MULTISPECIES: dienelactone hydrolase family protein [Ralstonia]|jgi:carboxymethylenebutenolidase|uniref:Dienelactone hydrolase-like enzyme n=1 Tax=Ralstonia pickettii OR214 TaxID=1264675 RepID=R0CLJ3_RALPI|nr:MULTISPECIES: dienelactone hydrolase family protein [Ralstonia]MEA3271780.1 dienelactone hydrolase family protein [Pseudomonadota bacterium]ENZ77561.1 dienelactone hydrolase-like enzyme [Ralstonia pickettii OR214]MBL4777400.1 dienelactone hydrolase family protein [Ralstonia sp.]MCM3579509.1 dienelactone hydrolase family protein [Ralstonia pickettii]MDR9386335.1 dienelactone hydrolase family protein [Ralstonia sp. 11b]